MAANGDLGDLEYLSPSFNPASLTVPKLRAVFIQNDISYPASAKKPQLIDIFNEELVPKSRKILAARERVRRTSRGITDMPSSQEATVNGDHDEDESMPPPPLPSTSKRKPRISSRNPFDEGDLGASGGRTSGSKNRSSKHARSSDTEPEHVEDARKPPARRTRKSEVTPRVKIEEPEDPPTRPPMRSSAFSDENPFQSGSSPIDPGDSRRRASGVNGDRRKSTSRRRRTEGVPSTSQLKVKQEDGIVVPSSKTFEVSSSKLRKQKAQEEPEDEIEAGEEFSPEETLELVRERAANGDKDILPPRRKKRPRTAGSIPKSAPLVILTTLLSGYALWLRQEKFEIGYCGVGRPSTALSNVQIPEWAEILQPSCEPCPQHAYCYEGMDTRCENDFILKPHPLSIGGFVPLPPSCEPDGEKVRRVKAVADRAVEELRDRNAKWECGTLVDEKGKSVPTPEIDAEDLKSTVAQKRRKAMSQAEFEDLWSQAIGEVETREEVSSNGRILRSTSLARLPLTCALRRSLRLTLARHRISLILLLATVLTAFYIRSSILSARSAKARIPSLVATTLDRLATQAALHARNEAPESWISVGQLRDDVLRDEFSAARREKMWTQVAKVVERNANVRASVREGRGGEVSKVWEWIGSVGLLGDGGGRESGRVSWVGVNTPNGRVESGNGTPNAEMEVRKWDEGRPIY